MSVATERATNRWHTLGRLAATLAVTCLALMASAARAGAETYWKDYANAYNIGLEGYIYGQPLLDADATFRTKSSVTVADHYGDAAVNLFSHFTSLAAPSAGVAPNPDTLYSNAWLDLSKGAIVLHVPPTPGRFDVVPMYSPYQENFANVGEGAPRTPAPGDYVIAGPGQFEGLTSTGGMPIIRSPYSRVWLLPRTLVRSKSDLASAVAIQAKMALVPLSRWSSEGLAYKPPAPEKLVYFATPAFIPGTLLGEDPLRYWAALGALLSQFQPPAADAEELALLRTVGIGPGMTPANDGRLSSGTLAGLRAAVVAGPGQVSKLFKEMSFASAAAHNGWAVVAAGQYGTNFKLRAVIDRYGRGALVPDVALYPFANADATGTALNATGTRYVAHYPAGDFPVPVQGFWSLTMNSPTGQLVANPLERFSLGDRSELHFEEDGSLNIYVQNREPTTATGRQNWLPAPAGAFQLIQRLYGLFEAATGPLLEAAPGAWTPPTILPCGEGGRTAGGWSCAS